MTESTTESRGNGQVNGHGSGMGESGSGKRKAEETDGTEGRKKKKKLKHCSGGENDLESSSASEKNVQNSEERPKKCTEKKKHINSPLSTPPRNQENDLLDFPPKTPEIGDYCPSDYDFDNIDTCEVWDPWFLPKTPGTYLPRSPFLSPPHIYDSDEYVTEEQVRKEMEKRENDSTGSEEYISLCFLNLHTPLTDPRGDFVEVPEPNEDDFIMIDLMLRWMEQANATDSGYGGSSTASTVTIEDDMR